MAFEFQYNLAVKAFRVDDSDVTITNQSFNNESSNSYLDKYYRSIGTSDNARIPYTLVRSLASAGVLTVNLADLGIKRIELLAAKSITGSTSLATRIKVQYGSGSQASTLIGTNIFINDKILAPVDNSLTLIVTNLGNVTTNLDLFLIGV